jgi:phytoene dehydrogenase-like protein
MTARHYDAVILGASLGSLVTAALLARRDFRVMLVGNGWRSSGYRFEGRPLRRRAVPLLVSASPAWRRILQELAQTPRFKRMTQPLDPMFGMVFDGRRVEVPPDVELFGREVEREFFGVQLLVDELYSTLTQVNVAADEAMERDAVWPPGSLWERWETGRATAGLPLTGARANVDLLGRFPVGHPFRSMVTLPVAFATDLAVSTEQLPPFATARLHGAWSRGIEALAGGEDELSQFLVERIEAHGGVCRLGDKANSLLIRRGRVHGVLIEGDEGATGADFVVTDASGEELAELAAGQGISPRAQLQWPRLTAGAGRFVTSLVVSRDLIPEALARESFLTCARGPLPDPRRPPIHLQLVTTEQDSAVASDEALLVAEVLVPTRGVLSALEVRDATLSTLKEQLPFLERHLKLVDSPHDGLPLQDWTTGACREIDRIHLRETSPGAEPMQRQWLVEPDGWLGLGGEPLRGPIAGTLLVGSTVLPALGQEGQLLAAWGAARIVTRKDRARQRMRRQLWSKIETT